MTRRLTGILIAFGLWLLLTWSLDVQTVIIGAVCSVLVGLMAGGLLGVSPLGLLNPRRWFWFLVFVPYFACKCVMANLDMAYRVIHPKMPIRPGVVRIRTGLQTDFGRTFLATSITLMPGTHVVDVVDDRIYVHWVNVQGEGEDEHTRRIVRGFEKLLRNILE
jgi:multicomponent Na+:H+ antiporter subunit E